MFPFFLYSIGLHKANEIIKKGYIFQQISFSNYIHNYDHCQEERIEARSCFSLFFKREIERFGLAIWTETRYNIIYDL